MALFLDFYCQLPPARLSGKSQPSSDAVNFMAIATGVMCGVASNDAA